MDVAAVEDGRLQAKLRCTRTQITLRRLYRLLHDVAKLARDRHLAAARQHDRLDRQQLATDFRPRQTGRNTDHVFAFGLAVTVLVHPSILAKISACDFDLFDAVGNNFAHRLALKVGKLALKIPDAGFTGCNNG